MTPTRRLATAAWIAGLAACNRTEPAPVESIESPVVEAVASEPVTIPAPAVAPTPSAPVVAATVPSIGAPAVEMVAIPAHTHRRSGDNIDTSAAEVALASFEIDRTPVSRAQYETCIAAGACTAPRAQDCKPSDDAAMHCVDMYEARSYCAWAGKQLPREDQWEAAQEQIDAGPKRHFEWTLADWCGPGEVSCRPRSDWAVDGWREEMIGAVQRGALSMALLPPHQADPHVGFRCVREAPVVEARTYPSPCWASCDGCNDAQDGHVDGREIAVWTKEGTIASTVVLDASAKPKRKATAVADPGALLAAADPKTIVRAPSGRVVALQRKDAAGVTWQEQLHHDAAGNLRGRVSSSPGKRQLWSYHYGCYAADAPRLHPHRLKCPRPGPPRVEPQTEFGRCALDEHGRWELLFEGLELGCTRVAGPKSPCEATTARGRWALRFTPDDSDWMTATEPSQPFVLGEIDVLERRTLAVFDYDGDGFGEIVLRRSEGASEEPSSDVEIMTYAGGTIGRYEPADAHTDIRTVEDVDGDGRPDLRRMAGLGIPHSGAMGDPCSGGVESVARSLPDGTFEVDPRETRKELLRQCPKAPTGALISGDDVDVDGEILTRIACAYLWGAEKADLHERVEREWSAVSCVYTDLGCSCDQETVLELVDALPKLSHRLGEP